MEPPSKKRRLSDDLSRQAMNGSYRSYNTKRQSAAGPDERATLLKPGWVENKRVLDIGCNAGRLTVQIAQEYTPYRCTGVDIDKELITLAKKHASLAFSRQKPLDNIVGRASQPPRSVQANYFPLAMPRMLGYLQTPPNDYLYRFEQVSPEEALALTTREGRGRGRGQVMDKEFRIFPKNVEFECADWVNVEIQDDKKGYDLILALSVSKWIHLNQGDTGLFTFFTRVFTCLKPNGRFILEAQDWASYKKPTKQFTALKQAYDGLKYRPADFSKILLDDIGFQSMQVLSSSSNASGFDRQVQMYIKSGGSWI